MSSGGPGGDLPSLTGSSSASGSPSLSRCSPPSSCRSGAFPSRRPRSASSSRSKRFSSVRRPRSSDRGRGKVFPRRSFRPPVESPAPSRRTGRSGPWSRCSSSGPSSLSRSSSRPPRPRLRRRCTCSVRTGRRPASRTISPKTPRHRSWSISTMGSGARRTSRYSLASRLPTGRAARRTHRMALGARRSRLLRGRRT